MLIREVLRTRTLCLILAFLVAAMFSISYLFDPYRCLFDFHVLIDEACLSRAQAFRPLDFSLLTLSLGLFLVLAMRWVLWISQPARRAVFWLILLALIVLWQLSGAVDYDCVYGLHVPDPGVVCTGLLFANTFSPIIIILMLMVAGIRWILRHFKSKRSIAH